MFETLMMMLVMQPLPGQNLATPWCHAQHHRQALARWPTRPAMALPMTQRRR